MTTTDDEQTFQRLLDENPSDYNTRLVLADLLSDVGDDRAEGYLIAGWARLSPLRKLVGRPDNEWYWMGTVTGRSSGGTLKDYWFNHLTKIYAPAPKGWHLSWGGWHPYYPSRREAEDDLARAWLKVDPNKRLRDIKDAIDRYSVRA